MKCLEAANIDLSEPLPVLENGNLDLLAAYMTGECKQAKREILVANNLFDHGQYKEAERYYISAKKHFASVRTRVKDIQTTKDEDFRANIENSAYILIPVFRFLLAMYANHMANSMIGDSFGAVDVEKIKKENKNSLSPLKRDIMSTCMACEQVCDDKIKRCRTGGL